MPEQSIAHIWSRFNRQWILAGVISGVMAGLIMMAIAMGAASAALGEATQAVKMIGVIVFGPDATEYGGLRLSGFVGFLIHVFLSAVYGGIFAQLVREEASLKALLMLGLVTSFIIWIFSCMLFMPSLNRTLFETMQIRFGLSLHILFGLTFGFILHMVRPRFLYRTS